MYFSETRGNDGEHHARVRFADALLAPMASFGGIYSPDPMPPIASDFLSVHLDSNYKQLAYALLQHVGIDVEDAVLRQALERYDRFDDPANPVPVRRYDEGIYLVELYHGPTRAWLIGMFGKLPAPCARAARRVGSPRYVRSWRKAPSGSSGTRAAPSADSRGDPCRCRGGGRDRLKPVRGGLVRLSGR